MTYRYQITNMTCDGCLAKVKSQLLMHPEILSADIKLEFPQAVITMQRRLSIKELQEAIGENSKYRIREDISDHSHKEMSAAGTDNWYRTYKPLILILFFITGISVITAGDRLEGMNFFMAGFFLVFSFFKFLDLKGFADSYAMYDLLAKRVKRYGYVYPFIELGLGLFYLTGFNPVFTNTATIVVMGFSSLGVMQSVWNKKQIRCACLGAVFNFPMSTVTLIEDLVMVLMAAGVLLQMH